MVIGLKAKSVLSKITVFALVASAPFWFVIPAHAQTVSACTGEPLAPDWADSFAEGQISVIERPEGYDFISMDTEAKQACPPARVIDIQIFFHDHLRIYNFVDRSTAENARFSDMQTNLLERSIAGLAPRHPRIRVLLVNIDVHSYPTDFAVFYQDNDLGPNGSARSDFIRPYAVYEASGIVEGTTRLASYALLNGVQHDADLNANADTIVGALDIVMRAVSQREARRRASE